MITITLMGLLIFGIALLILLIGAIAVVSPLAFVVVGLIALDACVFRSIFKKKKK